MGSRGRGGGARGSEGERGKRDRKEERDNSHRRSNERTTTVCPFWTLRKLFFFQNHRSCRSAVAVLRKLIRRPLFPPSLIECRGETNDTELSFESSLLGIRVIPLFPFSLTSRSFSFFLPFLPPLSFYHSAPPFVPSCSRSYLCFPFRGIGRIFRAV